MEIQLDASRLAAQTAATAAQGDTGAKILNQASPILGGENLKVVSAAATDLEKLVAQLKNENETVLQSIAQRRAAILSTVLDSMADRITAAEKENLLKIEESNIEKSDLESELAGLGKDKTALEILIDSLDRQIEQAVQDGKDHREKVEKLKEQRSREQAKLDTVNESIKSVSAKIAGVDAKIAECTKAIASSTLTEVYEALRAAGGDESPEAETSVSQAERDREEAKDAASDVALHISAALDRIDGQIRAALDEAQTKVEA